MSKARIPRKVSAAPPPADELRGTRRSLPPQPDLAAPEIRQLETTRFPPELKRAVENAVISAVLKFRRGVAAAGGDIDVRTLAVLRREWFWTVLLGFAAGARDMVLRGIWTAERFLAAWARFYRQAAQAAAIAWHQPHVDAELKNSPEWERFEAIRLEAIRAQPGGGAGVGEHKTGAKAKIRKKQAAVIVDLAWLTDKLKELNARRKPPDQLELSAKGLARRSPLGAPQGRTWQKLLKGEPLRGDVRYHLAVFFQHFGMDVEAENIPVDYVNEL